jgi:DNA-binding response OmpR family regulator
MMLVPLDTEGIPMGEDSEKPTTPSKSDQGVPENSKPTHKVLIVEDTVELAEVIQATLERMNLAVFHETHGDRALDVFKAEQPELVLLDIALPDTTGWKVLDTIREDRRGGRSPIIIVITAYGDPANRVMGKLQGIHSYLVKPLTPDEIEKVVSKALNLPAR